jgi:hypothetical protein
VDNLRALLAAISQHAAGERFCRKRTGDKGMAKIKSPRRPGKAGYEELQKLVRQTLTKDLRVAGIHPKIFIKPLRGTKLIRVTVTAPEFANLRPSERQDLVWRIVSAALSHDQQLLISMILTLTPHELVGKFPLRSIP